ncbi:MAG: MBOAT family protein [Tidjanibacter sp.]|nr:MBOAT family protein [Tidjanibacter sp.]
MFNPESFLEFWTYNPTNPLLFTSKGFLLLFTLFLIIYTALRKNLSARILYVTAFSLYFYYKTSGIYFLLIILMSITDFTIGYFLHREQRQARRKLWLLLSIVTDLGILCYFKYTDFFAEIVSDLINRPLDVGNIFLPVGISFFTFQSMSYVIDIYRRQLTPTRYWIDYLFYLSFFPQLVAGPIVRARDFLPQISRKPEVTDEMFSKGLILILIGLIKKAIISDYISLNFVDRVFDSPLQYSGFENLMGVYGYALQIYCDFSGYSDMAIGIALLLGFRFPKNFDLPYRSATITEFWRRWHISLSSWLKDYLYISLGGNRKGRIRTYVNLLITMLLGGLWHGAAWRFIIWGGLHGAALAVHKFLLSRFPGMKPTSEGMSRGRHIANGLLTFHFVCFCWIFFRAADMEIVTSMLSQIFTNFDFQLIPAVLEGYWKVFAIMALGYMIHFLPMNEDKTVGYITKMPLAVKVVLTVMVIWVVMQMKSTEIQPFIYFQF